jgi:hypothetical protein
MLVANNSPSTTRAPLGFPTPQKRSWLSDTVYWCAGIVLAVVVPLAIVLAAIVVSSYGIPLPVEVRVP